MLRIRQILMFILTIPFLIIRKEEFFLYIEMIILNISNIDCGFVCIQQHCCLIDWIHNNDLLSCQYTGVFEAQIVALGLRSLQIV